MRILRWLTFWSAKPRETNHELKLEILRVLLPGVSSARLSKYVRDQSADYDHDISLKVIFTEIIDSRAMEALVSRLETALISCEESERQMIIWRELEADSHSASLRESVTERFRESHLITSLAHYFEPYGIPGFIIELPLMCIPSAADIKHYFDERGHHLLSHRELIMEALIKRDRALLLERSRSTFNLFEGQSRPLFVDLSYAVAHFVSESRIQISDHSLTPAPLNRFIATLRRLVVMHPQHLYALHAVESVERWTDQTYTYRSSISSQRSEVSVEDLSSTEAVTL